MEQDDQIFIQLDADSEPIEFLIVDDIIDYVRAGIVTKDEIRQTVEDGTLEGATYSRTFPVEGYRILYNIHVRIDKYLRTVEEIEKVYF